MIDKAIRPGADIPKAVIRHRDTGHGQGSTRISRYTPAGACPGPLRHAGGLQHDPASTAETIQRRCTNSTGPSPGRYPGKQPAGRSVSLWWFQPARLRLQWPGVLRLSPGRHAGTPYNDGTAPTCHTRRPDTHSARGPAVFQTRLSPGIPRRHLYR